MMFSRGAKQSIEIICRRVSTPMHSIYAYSTQSFREKLIPEPKRNETHCTIVRKYSSEVSPSDHMNLIKKLRERTSAPIKEVKSALIDCNWDLGNKNLNLLLLGFFPSHFWWFYGKCNMKVMLQRLLKRN